MISVGYPNEHKYDRDIALARKEFPTVPVWVIKAVIATESCFDPGAYNPELGSDTGASRGLMQVTEKTARGMGYQGHVRDLLKPTVNIYYGTKLLSGLYRGNWLDAVSAYNGGNRHHLGFGKPIERPGVRCMGRIVPVGEYCNQKHVDRFSKHAAYFAEQEGLPLPFVPSAGRAPICPPPILRRMTTPIGLLIAVALGWAYLKG